jgi:hypothetical protein
MKTVINKQIVCISTHYWDDAWFRKQQFMSRFIQRGYQIAYIEPSFSIVRKPDTHAGNYQRNRMFNVSVERRGDNLFIIKPPRGLPFWSNPVMSRLNYRYFAFQLNRTLNELGFKDFILWLYRPEYAAGLKYFNYKKLVYDINDDLVAYEQEPHKQIFIKECMEQITRRSDLVIVTASTLLEKFRRFSKNIFLVPNGYDSSLFSQRRLEIPDDMQKINPPVIGFIGTLFSFLDYRLISYIVENNPDKSFVFIGNCEDNSRDVWTAITAFKNVFWLG